ncbi:Uncharacterized protein Rs2_34206 [Raphanus sativus]|nr:Uncharacterized protein Rs2_34206 [Raphanus sativus]
MDLIQPAPTVIVCTRPGYKNREEFRSARFKDSPIVLFGFPGLENDKESPPTDNTHPLVWCQNEENKDKEFPCNFCERELDSTTGYYLCEEFDKRISKTNTIGFHKECIKPMTNNPYHPKHPLQVLVFSLAAPNKYVHIFQLRNNMCYILTLFSYKRKIYKLRLGVQLAFVYATVSAWQRNRGREAHGPKFFHHTRLLRELCLNRLFTRRINPRGHGLVEQALVHVVNDASVSWNGITKSSTRSVPFVPVAVISIVRFAKKEPYMVAVRPSSKLRDAPQERITPESFRTVAGEAVTVLGSSKLLATRVARIAYHPIPRSRSAPRP